MFSMAEIEYILDGTEQTWARVIDAYRTMPDDSTHKVVFQKIESTGKWGMTKLWRAWMGSTGKWMAGNGATMPLCLRKDGSHYGKREFTPDDAHELFTAQWLGMDADGNRLSWSRKGRDGMRAATKGERYIAMLKHQDWASERGIMLFKPRDSEFSELERESNGQ